MNPALSEKKQKKNRFADPESDAKKEHHLIHLKQDNVIIPLPLQRGGDFGKISITHISISSHSISSIGTDNNGMNNLKG